ncbi:MAG: FAD-binding protein [Polyangiaceae bacterium]|nr:FAD-binding protein [Polyangiaceae bacterium]
MTAELPCEVEVKLGLDELDEPSVWRQHVAVRLGLDPERIPYVSVLKRSLDARHGMVRFRLRVRVSNDPPGETLGDPPPREVTGPRRVLIVGDGPAGLFAAYALARRGIPCRVVERGRPVQPRRHDLKALQRLGHVNPDSNYCFGEGGAGAYSDGKLYTRSVKRGNVRDVLEILVRHGAPPEILTDARPHIGSNRLPRVVTALREHLEAVGVAFAFESRVSDLLVTSGGSRRAVAGVVLAGGAELEADRVVVATGHSARDVHEILTRHGVRLEAKGFAIGLRIEHPQSLIDRIQYGALAGHPRLPPAAYSLAEQVNGRGVFTFCMCPGGFVVSAATEPDGLVVNGMSLSGRRFPRANAGLVVAVEADDLAGAGLSGPLGGVTLQRALERTAFVAGGGAQRAPATRVTDFLARRGSSTLPDTSYVPGLIAGDVGDVLDSATLRLADRLRQGIRGMGRRLRGFLTEEALLIAVETRTSSPVRVPRHPDLLESSDLAGLFPAGEGAGHAGGIVSAAVDGLRVGEAVARSL